MPTPGWGTRPQDIIDEAKARAAESVKQCSEQLCAKTKGREATKAEAEEQGESPESGPWD